MCDGQLCRLEPRTTNERLGLKHVTWSRISKISSTFLFKKLVYFLFLHFHAFTFQGGSFRSRSFSASSLLFALFYTAHVFYSVMCFIPSCNSNLQLLQAANRYINVCTAEEKIGNTVVKNAVYTTRENKTNFTFFLLL